MMRTPVYTSVNFSIVNFELRQSNNTWYHSKRDKTFCVLNPEIYTVGVQKPFIEMFSTILALLSTRATLFPVRGLFL